jgi:hypothetical protein
LHAETEESGEFDGAEGGVIADAEQTNSSAFVEGEVGTEIGFRV